MEHILYWSKIPYKKQYRFPKICVADFYLPKYKLAIFCDGEYWHRFPIGKTKDEEDVSELSKIGIESVRFWGKDILEREKVLEYLWNKFEK